MRRRNRAWRWLVPLVVAGLTLAAFWPALRGEFLTWDDDENFVQNPSYRGLGWAQLRWMFTTTHMGPYVPLAWLTLGADHALWGMDPWGYHLTSVLLHAIGAALLYAVARQLLAAACSPSPHRGEGRVRGPALTAGAVTAALFWALHPLRVESVAWITERRDVLVGVFTLLTVLAYLAAWRRGHDGRLHRGWLWTSAALFAVALLSKSTVVGLPLVLLVLDVYPLRRAAAPGSAWRLRRGIVEKLPFVAASAGFAALSLVAGVQRGMLTSLETLGVAGRLAISAYALAFYLAKTVLPVGLSPLYTIHHPVQPAELRYLAAAGATLAITAVLVAVRRRWPAGLAVWMSSLALALPVLGLLHNGPQIAADRYTYVPAMAWSLLPGAGVVWLAGAARAGRVAPRLARVARVALVAALGALAWLTVLQIGVWRDSVSLWRRAAAVEPESDIPAFYLGWTLAARGQRAEARAHFVRTLARVPASDPRLRAYFLTHIGILDQEARAPADAERAFREALALDPEQPVARIRLGCLLLERGQRAEAERLLLDTAARGHVWHRYKAVELREAVALVPRELAEARGHLAFNIGVLMQQLGARDQAEAQYRLTVELIPGHAWAWNNLGVLRARAGRGPDALEAFVRALRAQPGHRQACANGRLLAREMAAAPAELAACPAAGG